MYPYQQPPLSTEEAEVARVSGQQLARLAQKNKPLTFQVTKLRKEERKEETNETIELPAEAVELLMRILEAFASGRGVTLIPNNAELTTVQAAEILNVSRPFLIKLLEEQKIPYRLVGKHRRIRMEDVMAFKRAVDQQREAILDQLVADAQEQGMGYD
ncbi:MAG: DNA binding domain protein, excisionase family [Chloroflexi bacterium OLB15]|nr:MAG: DNA binding domain protein, excisionase family [Chloroflexi bacterium OLB15]